MSNATYIGIDLFAGAGGLYQGLSQAGFDMKLGIEMDSNFAETLKKNNKNMKVIISDIRKTDPTEAINYAWLQKKEINLIAGGPPC